MREGRRPDLLLLVVVGELLERREGDRALDARRARRLVAGDDERDVGGVGRGVEVQERLEVLAPLAVGRVHQVVAVVAAAEDVDEDREVLRFLGLDGKVGDDDPVLVVVRDLDHVDGPDAGARREGGAARRRRRARVDKRVHVVDARGAGDVSDELGGVDVGDGDLAAGKRRDAVGDVGLDHLLAAAVRGDLVQQAGDGRRVVIPLQRLAGLVGRDERVGGDVGGRVEVLVRHVDVREVVADAPLPRQ